jgi:nicotinamidase-related amidase
MKHMHGLKIPQTLDEHCDPRTMALLIYDMQVGIRSQIKAGDQVVERAGRALAAARGREFG